MSTTTTTTVTLQETVPLSFNTTIEPNEAREDTINDTNTHVEANNVPESWRRNYRRVPSRRPANPELDQSERPYGANPLEYTFISVMMQGVAMQSGFTKFWEATGARWWPGLTRWKIGGEW